MKSPDDITPAIKALYSEMGKDATELMSFSQKDMTYFITRKDWARTSLSRKDIDDYIDLDDKRAEHKRAKQCLISALSNFQHEDK